MIQYLKITLGLIVYGNVICQFKASHHESKTSHLLKLNLIKKCRSIDRNCADDPIENAFFRTLIF